MLSRRRRSIFWLWPILIFVLCSSCIAKDTVFESRHHNYRMETVLPGLEHPWSLAFLPDGPMLVTERPGRLTLFDPEIGGKTQISGVPEVAVVNQGGLLDVALHPGFNDNHWVYLSYSSSHGDGLSTHVGRGRLEGNRLEDFEVLFRAEPAIGSGRHFGSRLAFNDGYLFITVGDHGERGSAQDRGTHMGTVVRLHPDGSVPDDNPYVGVANARPEIFSYGHRNPQGLTVHPGTGEVWLHEHGPRGGDEINIPKAGQNYGWPKVTFGREYFGPRIGPSHPQPGFESPLHQWTPSIAPSGMDFYTGERFPNWQGDLFVGALALEHLARLRFNENNEVVEQERLLEDMGWRIREVKSGPDGYLYLLQDHSDAALLRMTPAS